MKSKHPWPLVPGILAVVLAFVGCAGDDGDTFITQGSAINASQVSDDFLGGLDVVSEIVSVSVASPPVVVFRLETTAGVPITGIKPFWEASSRYIRFTLCKLVPGTDGDPDVWVSYTRDAMSNDPDYDTGSSLVDNLDGTYTFTFNTNVTAVPGVPYEPTLTHRLGGQLGSGSVSLEAQNFVHDFVPTGAPVSLTRNMAVMDSCNECHDDLVFHGRRFRVEYCVTCHNPDLASGEGDFALMIHRIHSAGDFMVLDGGISYAEVTYPQDVTNCRKCHDGMDAATPDADNWNMVPNLAACFGCHDEADHPGGMPPATNQLCTQCHPVGAIEDVHTTPNATPNNPNLLPGQVDVVYDSLDASVDGMTNEVTINATILVDGSPLDVANLPVDLATPGRYPGFVLAWALPQDGIMEPQDYNNFGQRAAQPLSLSLEDFVLATIGTHSYDGGTGVNTFVVTDGPSQFPMGATLRAVGLQGYFQQDIMGDTVSLHTPSLVSAVSGDDERRTVVDSSNCSNCHEWFEGHGGNRVLNMQICTLCHVPNLSSTGRSVTDPTARSLDVDLLAAVTDGSLDPSVDENDPLTYPEDAQSFKNLVHGIHSSGFRTDAYQHVRGPSRQGYYDWSHVTFPRGAETSKCSLCHDGDTYALPLPADLLATTVRTTLVADGQDLVPEDAFVMMPNINDWVHTPVSGTCVGCHNGAEAAFHMELNGGLLSQPWGDFITNRQDLVNSSESCTVCHGPGRVADIEEVHDF